MRACPLTFEHPSEAQQLDGIGPKICEHLTDRLNEHCRNNGLPMPKRKRKCHTGDDLSDGAENASKAARKPRKKKAYVPALRSGAFALVLALSSIPEDSLRSFSKSELIILAQPLCDSSFEVSSEGNKFYSAWSSMKTLTEKDLVQEMGRPSRRYYLSDEGWEVARKIRAVQNQQHGPDLAMDERNMNMNKNKQTTHPPPTIFQPKPTRNDFVDVDQDFREETPMQPQSMSVETLTGETQSTLETQKSGLSSLDQHKTSSSYQTWKPESNIVDLLSSPEPERSRPSPPKSSSFKKFDGHSTTDQVSAEPLPGVRHAFTTLQGEKPSARAKISPQDALLSAATSFPSFTPLALAPGTFTVQLVLDTREVRSKTDRDYVHDELSKKGIKPILRALELGDFFWVAKLKDPTLLFHHGEADEHSDELALDWIVERKRLDDLVGSITDGRFSEQKFRLQKSGIKNVVYLIEDFSLSSEKETRFHDAIQTAIASTQVVNGYFVKKTQKIDDTIRYIARLTRMLQSLYESKPLHLIPTRAIEGGTTAYLSLLNHLRSTSTSTSVDHNTARTYSLTYSTFASLSSKTDNLTLRDVFLKMLLCTKGLSAEKALAVQRIWNTPRALIEALEACETEKQRDGLLAKEMDRVVMVGRARVKGALSLKVARIWGEE